QRQQLPMVAVPPPVDRHVHHCEWPRSAMLHRAVRAAWLRELHARRRDAADLAGNLAGPGISSIPARAQVRQAACDMRELRITLEPIASTKKREFHEAGFAIRRRSLPASPALDSRSPVSERVAVVIPTLNEAESISAVIS